jgi:hypothetical protein
VEAQVEAQLPREKVSVGRSWIHLKAKKMRQVKNQEEKSWEMESQCDEKEEVRLESKSGSQEYSQLLDSAFVFAAASAEAPSVSFHIFGALCGVPGTGG